MFKLDSSIELSSQSPYQKIISQIKDLLNQNILTDIPPLTSDRITTLLDLLYSCLVPSSSREIETIPKTNVPDKEIETLHQHAQDTKPLSSVTKTPRSLTRTAKFLLEKLEASEKKKQETKSPAVPKQVESLITKNVSATLVDLPTLPSYPFESCNHKTTLSSNIPLSISLPKYSFE